MGTKRAKLYILVGYPGAGKTTVSQIIHSLDGAVHIWADYERRAMFGEPTHSKVESDQLYDHLNKQAELLLEAGQSVIFDTNFNYRRDRDTLRRIADKHGADTRLVWLKLRKDTAKRRALHISHALDNKYTGTMLPADFERMVSRLEPPTDDEQPVILDGTLITPAYVAEKLDLPRKDLRQVSQAFQLVRPAGDKT